MQQQPRAGCCEQDRGKGFDDGIVHLVQSVEATERNMAVPIRRKFSDVGSPGMWRVARERLR
jgi:hypothetical protein